MNLSLDTDQAEFQNLGSSRNDMAGVPLALHGSAVCSASRRDSYAEIRSYRACNSYVPGRCDCANYQYEPTRYPIGATDSAELRCRNRGSTWQQERPCCKETGYDGLGRKSPSGFLQYSGEAREQERAGAEIAINREMIIARLSLNHCLMPSLIGGRLTS
jgi:hypothetical protein